jgi:hypothetical protein
VTHGSNDDINTEFAQFCLSHLVDAIIGRDDIDISA